MDSSEDSISAALYYNSQLDHPLCLICGSKSTGIHYGVVACEGCKAFYKRGLIKSVNYKCFFGGTCVVGPMTSGRCKSCRFQKCVQVGMTLQGTKMGRTPKRKIEEAIKRRQIVRSGQEILNSRDHSDPAQLTKNRNIAPASNNTSQIDIRRGNFGIWSTRPSVIQSQPPNSAPSTMDLLPYIYPSTPSWSVSSGESENEKSSDISHLIFESNYAKYHILSRSDMDGVARFSPDSLWSLRGIRLDSHSPPSSAAWVPSDLIPSLTDGVNGQVVAKMPDFLGQYCQVLKAKKYYLEQTVRAVADSVRVVFEPDLRLFDDLLWNAVAHGLVPHQPQHTPEQMLVYWREGMVSLLQKQIRFLTAINGFSELSPSDQRIIITDRCVDTYLIIHFNYSRNGDMYYLSGPDMDIFISNYWLSQFLEQDYLDFTNDLMGELKNLRLNRVESFLLLAVATFNPDTTTAKDKTTLSFLYAHYLDCLLQSIRVRQGPTEGHATVNNLLQYMSKFRLIYRFSKFYIGSMEWTSIPLQAKRHGALISSADIFAMEDDGMAGYGRIANPYRS